MKDMTKLSSYECYGEKIDFKGSIFIESEKYNELSEESQKEISWVASGSLETIKKLIAMEWAKANETNKRNAHASELTELFKSAGFDTIYVKIIDSQYCDQACCYKKPWIIVTTQKGNILFGWRKKVMELDWSESDIKANGKEIFKGENTTTGNRYVHCWGQDKAIEYLKKLRNYETVTK